MVRFKCVVLVFTAHSIFCAAGAPKPHFLSPVIFHQSQSSFYNELNVHPPFVPPQSHLVQLHSLTCNQQSVNCLSLPNVWRPYIAPVFPSNFWRYVITDSSCLSTMDEGIVNYRAQFHIIQKSPFLDWSRCIGTEIQ
jgi:hypothetical protein